MYKNANGCILVYDITKQWTWEYIERELPKIPKHIPVLIVGNHRDMHHHRSVDPITTCRYFLDALNRGSLGSAVRYMEASMRTGFGLKYIYQFFNVPFLQLQRENLMQQLETNAKEMDTACEELEQMEQCMDDDYERFAESLNAARRREQEKQAPQHVLKNAKSIDEAKRAAAEREQKEKELQARLAAAPINLNADDPKLIVNQIITKVNAKIQQHVSTATSSTAAVGSGTSSSGSNGNLAATTVKLDPSVAASMSSSAIQNAILTQQKQLQQQQQQTVKQPPDNNNNKTVGSNNKHVKLAMNPIEDPNNELNKFLNENDPFR